MWFCHKCNEWFDNSVTILKHFQNFHNSPESPVEKEISKISNAPTQSIKHITKEKGNAKQKLTNPLVKKIERNEAKLNNGGVKAETKNGIPKVYVKNSAKKLNTVASNTQSKKREWLEKDIKNNNGKKLKIMPIKNPNNKDSSEKPCVKMLNKDKILQQIRTYVCKYCCRRFYTEDLLKTHLKSHGNNPIHTCYVCGLQTGTFSALMTHYVKHSSLKDFVSPIPSKSNTVSNDAKLKDQSISDKAETAITCTQCKRLFHTRDIFNSHYCPTLNKKTDYKCAYCGNVTSTVEEYRDHIQSHSATPFVCTHCMRKFDKKIQLDQHLKVCSKSAKVLNSSVPNHRSIKKEQHIKDMPNHSMQFFCPHCSTKFEKKAQADQHMKTCTNLTQTVKPEIPLKHKIVKTKPLEQEGQKQKRFVKRFSCSYCKTKFAKKIELIQHICSKSAENVISLLDSPCNTNENLQSAMPNLTQSIYSSNFACVHCPATFQKKTELNKHVQICSPSSKFGSTPSSKFDSTPSSISSEDNLQPTRRSARLVIKKQLVFSKKPSPCKNQLPKNEESENITEKKIKKNFECKIKKKLKSLEAKKSSNLYCNMCSLTFCSMGSLRRHKKMHSGTPQFICQFCGKYFFRRDIFIRHEKNVHQKDTEQIFCCFYCKLTFDASDLLKDHVISTHAGHANIPTKVLQQNNEAEKCQDDINVYHPKIKLKISKKLNCKRDVKFACTTNFRADSEYTHIVNKPCKTDTTNLGDENAYQYDCGMCHISFMDLKSLGNHFQEVHGVSDFKNIVQLHQYNAKENCKESDNIESGDKSSVCIKESNSTSLLQKCLLQPKNDPLRTEIILNEETSSGILKQQTIEVSEKLPCSMIGNQKMNMNSKLMHELHPSPKFDMQTHLNKAKTNNTSNCILCLKEFTSSEALLLHEEVVHKMIDWYQCIICDTCGPQSKVQEHMLTHMYKVGTFIVNSEDENFNSLTPYLTQTKQNLESHCAPSYETCCFDPSLPVLTCSDTSKLMELNPEHTILNSGANSGVTLTKEVTCNKCSEVIKNLDYLFYHPCMQCSVGTFSCCVDNCSYTCANRSDIQNHLIRSHDLLFGGSRSHTHTATMVKPIVASVSTSTKLRVSNVEDLIVEPSVETLTSLVY